DPFIIDSLVDLQAIDRNATTRGYHYRLGTDIDAGATRNWDAGAGFVPITTFTGSFDGAGREVVDLHIDADERVPKHLRNAVGLFGEVGSGGRITGLHLENANVEGGNDVGALVGDNQGTIAGSSATGNVTGQNRVGGLIGNMGSKTVSNSYADVTVQGNSQVGGLNGVAIIDGAE
ncbi:MAG: hypothetical protein RI531_10245, partial [Haloferacaceae archaeon]|nr:hypothetical protein [Haloferacaceae archaeon]